MSQNPKSSGIFVTLEGGEGSGKTTQTLKLAEALRQEGFEVLTTREPGGTEIGKAIRQILLDGNQKTLAPATELLLYSADRRQHVEEVIRPSLEQKKIVLCDRFQDSTTVYQGMARGLENSWIQTLAQIATDGLKPHLTLLLDINPEIGLKRSLARLEESESGEDRFEKENIAFHHKVRQGFLALAKNEPDRFRVLEANQDPEKLHQAILKYIREKL